MNKRRNCLIVLACIVLLCASAFAACVMPPIDLGEHTHIFVGRYLFDDTYHWQTCICGEEQINPHDLGDWIVVKQPTSNETGLKKATCKTCGYEKQSVLSSLLDGDKTVDMYAINDFHGVTERIAPIGGYLKQAKQNNPNTVLINSGDMFQGSLESNANFGHMLGDCMDEIGFDSFTFGNHEFDWGTDKVKELVESTNTPFLGANIYKWDSEKRVFGEYADDIAKQYVVTTLPNGVKVGIIGVIGKDQITSICSDKVADIGFKNPIEVIPSLANKLRADEGCHVVVVSIHAPAETLFNADGFNIDDYADAVFCAHSHEVERAMTSGGTPFLQGGSKGQMISHMRLTVAAEEVNCNLYENINFSYAWNNDNNVQTIVDKYIAKLEVSADTEIAVADQKMASDGEVPRLACRAMAEYAVSQGHDIVLALCNYGRTFIDAGTITYGELYKALPFDNTVYIAEVTGANLLSLCRYGNFIWRVSGEQVVNDSGHVYKIAVIDYVLMHQNSDRMYDKTYSAFQSGRMKPIALTKADGSAYNYREMTRDFLIRQDLAGNTIAAELYNGKNVYTNTSLVGSSVTLSPLQ